LFPHALVALAAIRICEHCPCSM